MSKIRERFIHNSFSSYAVNILWYFISPYRKSYSSNHVILRLTENWKKYLDKNKIFGTVLMHLWKDFDGMPHDLLFANFMHMVYQKMQWRFYTDIQNVGDKVWK